MLCLENYLPPLPGLGLSAYSIFDHVFHDLAKKTLAASSDTLVTDTSFIKNIIRGRRDQVLGRNRTDRGRMATKLSLLCYSEGLPLHYVLHCGNKADTCLLRHLLVDAERFLGTWLAIRSWPIKAMTARRAEVRVTHWALVRLSRVAVKMLSLGLLVGMSSSGPSP